MLGYLVMKRINFKRSGRQLGNINLLYELEINSDSTWYKYCNKLMLIFRYLGQDENTEITEKINELAMDIEDSIERRDKLHEKLNNVNRQLDNLR